MDRVQLWDLWLRSDARQLRAARPQTSAMVRIARHAILNGRIVGSAA